MILVSNCVSIWKWYDVVDTFKENKNLLKNLALRLNDVKTFLYVITKINTVPIIAFTLKASRLMNFPTKIIT